MNLASISSAVTAEESREIISTGIRMQFDLLDSSDPLNYYLNVEKLQATALKFGLTELVKELENDK